MSCDVVILTDGRYEQADGTDWYQAQLLHEERLLSEALQAVGLQARRLAWSNPGFDWRQTRCAVFRSTWDYFDRFDGFTAWVAHADERTLLINPAELVRWNWDKHYLGDLARRGIGIPSTRFIERGTATTLAGELAAAGWAQAVLKPAVSGAARHTYRLDASNAGAHEAVFAELLRTGALLLQEFQASVLSGGEISLIVIGGACTHAVRKRAKAGDFRVQDDHGGTVRPHRPSPDEVAFAERVVAACAQPPLYARVDAVRDAHGELALMELELIEPELFLRFHPPAASALAGAIRRVLEGESCRRTGMEPH